MTIAKNIVQVPLFSILLLLLFSFSCSSEKKLVKSTSNDLDNRYILLSMELVNAAKEGSQAMEIREELAKVAADTLEKYLQRDDQKKAFWINVYNSHIQFILSHQKELFKNRNSFFSSKQITIAGKNLSFDDIEHGIIRSSKFKLALGLIRNPFANKFEKQFRTRNTDGRVHFALNCGAKSCPLVATYNASNFSEKIDEVAKSFLMKMSTYNKEENKIYTTPLFSWFRGDFGGSKGIKEYLKRYMIIPPNTDPDIVFNSYDWTLSLGNYYEK